MFNRKVKICNKKDLVSSFLFFLFGVFLALLSSRLLIWSSTGPQEGFFPLLIATIIIGLSLLIISKSIVLIPRHEEKDPLEEQEKRAANIFGVFSYGILILLYGIFLEKGGFLVVSTLFLILTLRYIERQNWRTTILVGSAFIIMSYLLFVYFLRVPLPKGIIK